MHKALNPILSMQKQFFTTHLPDPHFQFDLLGKTVPLCKAFSGDHPTPKEAKK
jgi:hypothetical protein